MNTKKLYARALKKLREIPDIADEVDIVHRYVGELREPHVEVQKVVVRDDDAIKKMEVELAELRGNFKRLQESYPYEKAKPEFPPPPKLKDRRAVFNYIRQMASEGQNLIDQTGGGVPADYGEIIDGYFSHIVNHAGRMLNFGTDNGFTALPFDGKNEVCGRIHLALHEALIAEMKKAHAVLGGRADELFGTREHYKSFRP